MASVVQPAVDSLKLCLEDVSSNASAFAARLQDGSVVTWGDPAFGG